MRSTNPMFRRLFSMREFSKRRTSTPYRPRRPDRTASRDANSLPADRLLCWWRRLLEHERVLVSGPPWPQSLARFLRMHGFHVTAQVAVVTVDAATHGTRPGSLPGHTLHSQPTHEHTAAHRYCNSTSATQAWITAQSCSVGFWGNRTAPSEPYQWAARVCPSVPSSEQGLDWKTQLVKKFPSIYGAHL
jgi:hypothetical protein